MPQPTPLREDVSTGDFTASSQYDRDFTRPLHVLLVEDDPDTREMYAIFFATAGLRVDQAEDAVDAMRHIATACPDVAIVDVALPRTDGIELCRQIRHHAGDRSPALIAITGLCLGGVERARLRDAGVDALLIKPCLPDDLAAEVRRVHAICSATDKTRGHSPDAGHDC